MTLNKFVKEKVDFKYDQIWLWVSLSKQKLTLDISKYDFENVIQKKINFRHIQIWL
jgi:AAA15 family ATPase/GTPase